MTTLKVIFTVLIFSFLIIEPAKSDDGIHSANKTAELNIQIIQEVKEVLKTPYLKFASMDLNGEVKVVTRINDNGKIIFTDIKGVNENLVSNIVSRLNSLNLWTSPDYSSKIFEYKIRYKN